MSNTAIKLKKSGVTGNTPSGLANGELALNFADGKLYYKNSLGGTSYISNQFSFDTINSNNSLILAGSGSDTLSFVAGNNITISTNTTTKTITINASDSSAFGSANSASLYANGAFTAANNALPKTGGTVTGNVTLSTTATMIIQNTRPTTSNSTGALIVDGGLAVKGNTWISGVFTVDGDFSVGNQTTTGNVINNGLVTFTQPTNFTNTNPSTSNTTGGVIVSGGIGVKGNVYAGAIRVQNTTPSVSNTTGALTVAGGVGIRGNLYVGGIFTVDGDFQVGNQNTSGNVYNTGNVTFTQITQFTSNTASTSNSTGAVVVAGGVGIKGNVHTGGIRITGSTSNGITFVDGTKQYTANVGVSIATSAFNHANAAFNASNNSIIPGGSGNAISFAVDRFTANGATTTFNLSVSTSSNTYTTVVVDGIVQHKDTYSILGDVITFDSTFENGANIEVTSTTLSTTSFINRTFVGDGTTNNFTISYNTTANSILVFGNGITQNPLSDYTVSGNNLIFVNPPTNGTIIQVRELAPVVNVTYTIDTTTANIAFDTANAAYTHANAAYNQANTGGTDSWVRTQANNAYDTANSVSIFANGAFGAANSASLYANAAFEKANTYPGNADQILYKNSSNVLTSSSGLRYDGTHLKVNGNLETTYSSGDEGGEIFLSKSVTNTTLSTGVTIDIYQNKFRIFESGGSNRGVYIDMANGATSGIGVNLLAPPGGSVTSVSGATGAVSNTQLIAGIQSVSSSYGITFDYVATANNGQGTNFKVGDDAWIGDYNAADSIKIKGQQNAANGYVSFGSNTSKLGVAGSGQLTYDGNTVWHAGNDGAGSGLDADLLDGLTSSDFARVSAESFANGAFIQSNAAFIAANSASIYANGAFTAANTADGKATSAGLYANGAFVVANSAASFADGAFTKANSANVLAQASFDTANSAASFANGAFTTANLKFNSTGGTISGDVNITGNLSITGNTFSTSATQIVANDTLFIMGTGNYSGDILDIGFAGHYNNGTNAHTGLIRDAGTKEWQLFEEYTPEIGADNNINITDGSFKIATLNANVKSTTIAIKGIDLLPYVNSVFDKANSGASFANLAFDQANSAALYANGAFTKANNTLSLTGGTIAGNVTANSFIANNSIYSPIFYSSGGTTNLTLSDIGIVAINSGGQEIKFGGSGIESSKGIYGGSYGGNKLSLDNETKLISNRYDIVKIATGTDGTTVNEWSFSNNQLIFPDSTYQNTAFQGVAIDQTSRNTANSGASFANSAFAAANAAFIQANAAFSQANTGGGGSTTDIYARDTANAAFIQANAAFAQANTGGGSTTDTYARDTANAAFIQANAAFSQANTGGTSLSKAIAMSIVFGF